MAKITFMKILSTAVLAEALHWPGSVVSLTILRGFSSTLHRRVVWHSDSVKRVSEAKGITTPPVYMTFLVCYVLNPVDYKVLYIQIR